MDTLSKPQGTLPALRNPRLHAVYNRPEPTETRPPLERVARHIGRELLAIRHDRARLTEALLHLAEL
jgi:hypothetical protein